MEAARVRAAVIEPDGRTVVLTDDAWEHITENHRDMARFERVALETVSHPLHRQPDVRPGRERYFSMNKGPSGSKVVTAFGHDNDP